MIRTLLFLTAMLMTACSKEEIKDAAPPPLQVTAIPVIPRTIPATYEYVGVAQSSHPVEIRARVEGYLDKIAYQEGSLVEVDQLLFQIDPRPFQAALDNAKADLERQKAILWNAQRTRERLDPLYKQNAASRRDLDNAIAQELTAIADVDASAAKVREAELNLSYTTITSPIRGLSGQSSLREGALVTPGPNGLLTTISVIDPIWVNFNVSDGDILKFQDEEKKGLIVAPKDKKFTVELTLADGSTFPFKGTIDFTEPTLQQSTGTMMVRAVFRNPELVLRPGQFVRAKASGAIRPNAIIIPQKAVLQGSKGMFVYLVGKDNKAHVQPIEAGGWYESFWIIKSGLQEGDLVIVEGINKVKPGQSVSVKGSTGS